VPTIGIAYSHKFIGVFQSVGTGDSVVDLRTEDEVQIVARIQETFNKRFDIEKQLSVTIPKVQKQVLSLFDEIHCES